MEMAGAIVVIATCLLTHLYFTLDFSNYFFLLHSNSDITSLMSSIGLLLLAFPLLGYLTDVHFTRYKAIKVSLLVQVLSLITWILAHILSGLRVYELPSFLSVAVDVIVTMGTMIAVGLFDANAIQFGLDQLLGASSSQLSRFIHWYFWAQHVGQLALFYTYVARFFHVTSESGFFGKKLNHY